MLFRKAVLSPEQETLITIAQHGAVDKALEAGMSVIVDDTNLFTRGVRNLMKIAGKHDVEVVFTDFTDVPLEECIRRDKLRRDQGQSNLSQAVGEEVIRNMHRRYILGRQLPLPIPDMMEFKVESYDNPEDLPSAIIVDIDGTLAKMNNRSPYEWNRVGEDSPVKSVIAAVRAAHAAGDKVLVMSGRDGSCFEITLTWLETNVLSIPGLEEKLFMRTANDNRRDDLVKYELFNDNVRGKYHVRYVLDDRDQVVRMWRKLGLATFQVAPGNF
jgi:hypothetical protein